MSDIPSFGAWLKRRRKALDLTQEALARLVSCSVVSIRKFEGDTQRPSRQLAELLAAHLQIPSDEHATFVQFARQGLNAAPPELPLPAEAQLPHAPPPPQRAGGLTAQPASDAPARRPSGTVTFLFTDIEGSTRLWEQHAELMPTAFQRQETILRQAIASQGGYAYKMIGDAFQAAFATAQSALTAGVVAQRALLAEDWGAIGPLRVRIALDSGVAEERGDDYVGPLLNRTARLLASGHGGQILLSAAAHELAWNQLPPGVSLRDLGIHQLKDITRPEHVFQVAASDLLSDFPPLRTQEMRTTNLPAQLTSFIGRENEIAEIKQLLANHRLTTLTGPGGTGKTRLALQIAAELLDEFGDGVWFVNLAPLREPGLVASSIAQTLGIKESASRSLLDSLKDYLEERQLLLLLDNFEQVADAAPLVSELLAASAGLKVLTTSRTPLHLLGEREYAVAPLGLPPAEPRTKNQELGLANRDSVLGSRFSALSSVAELTQYEAVRLFIERAQAVKADFTVTNANAPAVAEICCRLDGLPLAIELAAARIKLLPPQALLTRLAGRLKLLTGGARDLPERQQTIRNTIDWSYQLLDAGEKTLFTRLGVFIGGWTLEAAEAVCNADGNLPTDVVDGTAALLNQSLVRQIEQLEGEPRFVMLETVREYALERLAEREEADAVGQQHATYFLALAEQAEPWIRFMRPERDPWLERLEVEQDNLRAALEWFDEREELELVLQLAGALVEFWWQRFYWREGRAWLEAALAKSLNLPGAARAKALVAAAYLAQSMGDITAGRRYIDEGLALFRALGDKAAIAYALLWSGLMRLYQSEYAIARVNAEESLALFDEVGEQWGRPYALHLLGHIATAQGDVARGAVYADQVLAFYRQIGYKEAIGISLNDKGTLAQLQDDWDHAVALYEESLAIAREVGNKDGIALGLHNLGVPVLHQGDRLRAATSFAEGLIVSREIGARNRIAINLAGMAGVAAARGQPERSARLFGAADALFDAMGMAPELVDRLEYDRNREIARAQLGDEAFAAAWAKGRAMTIEQAVAEALEVATETPAPPLPSAPQPSVAAAEYPAGLTGREVEVLRLVAQGLTDAQVAEQLVISIHTVHAHLRAIYGKLDVTSRAAATRFALEHQLV